MLTMRQGLRDKKASGITVLQIPPHGVCELPGKMTPLPDSCEDAGGGTEEGTQRAGPGVQVERSQALPSEQGETTEG